jgi:hypothetical protein
MALCYLLDENLRGPLWRAIQQHNAAGIDVLECLCVGHPPAPPLGTPDPDLLAWCDGQGRVLISLDKSMIGAHVVARWQAGEHLAGVILLRSSWAIPAVIAALVHLAPPL